MIRIENLQVPVEQDRQGIHVLAATALGISLEEVESVKIIRKSLDARRKTKIHFVYTLDVQIQAGSKPKGRSHVRMVSSPQREDHPIVSGGQDLIHRPVIVGAGPAGLFAAVVLSAHGYQPMIIERGKRVEERLSDVRQFWTSGRLNLESNVAFGEGGAGTFSDGKLMTRVKSPQIRTVLELLVSAGAPDSITYLHKPHLGTDRLQGILIALRNRILAQGGRFHFSTKMTGLNISKGRLTSINVNDTDEIPCEVLLLCTGHSARDTYQMLLGTGVEMEAKAFAVGLRIEHPQEMINMIQYGPMAGHESLPPAEYQLTYQSSQDRGVYSFCMCPGGAVVGAATEAERLVVNGMSGSKRSGRNANAALICVVDQRDMGTTDPLAGVHFQRHWEEQAYREGLGGFTAPAQNVGDFLKGNVSKNLNTKLVKPTYRPGVETGKLERCLPKLVIDALKEGLVHMNRKMPGFSDPLAILTGIESRTSAPVRILRGAEKMGRSIEGLFPAGEGAGYAGGIVSAAIDGIEVAEAIIRQYKKPKISGE